MTLIKNANTKNKKIILVDSSDQPIGEEEKLKTHQLGLLHRAFSIFIYREKNQNQNSFLNFELLLQKRQADKYHSGHLWTNTCCSHPSPNETILEAASRRLLEELGMEISPEKFKNLTYFIYRHVFQETGLIEHELDHIVTAQWQKNWSEQEELNINPEEVAEVKWIDLPALDLWLKNKPEDFTPWFSQAYTLWKTAIKI